jgi:ketosteroid isomerase-like protein
MKKFLLLTAAGILGLAACNNDEKKEAGGGDDAAKKNLAAVNAINKAIETGDVSKLGDVIAADAVDHGANPMGIDVVGVDSIKAVLGKLHTMADSMKATVTKELADGEYVMQWLRFTGISKSMEMGVKPGEHYDMNAIELCKMKDGKITEHWEFMQAKDMMKMVASMPPPPPPAKKGEGIAPVK